MRESGYASSRKRSYRLIAGIFFERSVKRIREHVDIYISIIIKTAAISVAVFAIFHGNAAINPEIYGYRHLTHISAAVPQKKQNRRLVRPLML